MMLAEKKPVFLKNDTLKVKGGAILLLIFHHMYRTVDDIAGHGITQTLISPQHLSEFAFCCRICVYVFAILSAYGLTLKYKQITNMANANTLKFIVTRYIKLMSSFWFTLLLLWITYFIAPGLNLENYRVDGNLSIALMIEEFFGILDLLGKSTNMLSGVFWYMNFAIVEIFSIPILFLLTEKVGLGIFPLTMMFFNFIPNVYQSPFGGDYTWYVFCIEIGIFLADSNYLNKMINAYSNIRTIWKILILSALFAMIWIFPYLAWFKTTNYFGFCALLHSLGALCFILFIAFVFGCEKRGKVLLTIGQYSSDMYLIHTIIFLVFFKKIIFSTHSIFIQYFLCVTITFLVSFIISSLKKYSKYNYLINNLCEKISGNLWVKK